MNRYQSYIVCVLLLGLVVNSFHILPVHSQPTVALKVTRAVWGENIDSPTKAYPGGTETPLTVEVQNLSPDQTIKGVSAVLIMGDGPFKDVYGNSNATATGKPTVGELLNPTDEIAPKGFLTFTFTLDIDEDAVPSTYRYNMTVQYSVETEREFVEGTPQMLVVELTVSKISSTLTISVSPQTLEKGEAIKVSGSIDPIKENVTVTLTYKKPDGLKFNSTVRTTGDSQFSESYRPETEGFWSVNASWLGDEKYEGNWVSTSFEVRLPVSLSVATSDDRLTGGLDNQFNMTLTNDGTVPISAVDVTLSVPSPLIVHGANYWTFSYLGPGNSTFIAVEIFAPESSIGTTYSGSLTINYRDDYGESRTDTYPIGLIVTGRVELVVYSETLTPQPAKNGSRVIITTTLLNRGNVAAMYVNASVLPNPILDLTSESVAYVGEVDENSQTPFTLAVHVNANAENGTYPITLSITYRDDQYIDRILRKTVFLTVETSGESQTSSEESDDTLRPFSGVGLVLLTVLAASIVVLLLYRRHLAKQRINLKVSGQV